VELSTAPVNAYFFAIEPGANSEQLRARTLQALVNYLFDFARHKRVINLARNYVRLNEFPEWFVVEPNWLYRITGGTAPARLRLGSELMQGERFTAGDWRIEPLGPPPYGNRTIVP
jgi:hypothetical protein